MSNWKKRLKFLLKKRERYIIILTFILWVTIALINDNFATGPYLIELIGFNGVYFICALGVLPLMIKGNFDLSVGGIMAVVSLFMVLLLSVVKLPLIVVLLLGGCMGGLLGRLNGLIISKLKVSSVVVTLAMLYVYYGLARFFYRNLGKASMSIDSSFSQMKILGMPLISIVIMIMLLLTTYFLKFHQLGRLVFIFGENRKLAIRKGFEEEKITVFLHSFSGFSAGIAAIMHVMTFGQVSIEAYNGIEFELIIIVIMGGLNILGGYGTVLGTFVSTLFIVILKSGLVFAKISVFWHDMLIGIIIILLVSYEMFRHKAKMNKCIGQGE